MSKEEFYEQYHKKGGDYVIPVEVFNDLLDNYEETESKKKIALEYITKKSILSNKGMELYLCDGDLEKLMNILGE